jgi:hypothetical protein
MAGRMRDHFRALKGNLANLKGRRQGGQMENGKGLGQKLRREANDSIEWGKEWKN